MERCDCILCGGLFTSNPGYYETDCDNMLSDVEMIPDYRRHDCSDWKVSFCVHNSIMNEEDPEMKNKILNLITEHLARSKSCVVNGEEYIWHFYHSQLCEPLMDKELWHIDLAPRMKNYPTTPIEIVHRGLLNLALLYPDGGRRFRPSTSLVRFLYGEKRGIVYDYKTPFRLLEDFGFIKQVEGAKRSQDYIISAEGWQKVAELREKEQAVEQGFIAMIFRDEAKSIREAFKDAIMACGYDPMILDEKEHNNQIVPEIFYEIKRSKFAVVDVTYTSLGAYYEAGYAQALGKEVIVCCREDIFNDPEKRPHFDIAQKAIITWKDEKELVTKLIRRIKATVA